MRSRRDPAVGSILAFALVGWCLSTFATDYEDLVVFEAEDVRLWLEPTGSFIDHIASLIARQTR